MEPYFATDRLKIYHGDCRDVLTQLPDESVHTIVTSPPYYGLRDYQVDDQLGLEQTPDEYITSMVEVFREVRRVLREDGTLWLNMGDSYAADKDLIGIPWRLALALQADGWWLRSDIIWSKPNPIPESVRDRPTKAHEYLFLLAKSQRYYFDQEAVKEPADNAGKVIHLGEKSLSKGQADGAGVARVGNAKVDLYTVPSKRNIRSVWTIPTQPYSEAHFATFPPKLVEPCIKAGCPEGGTVLDPFHGSGTTGQVALNHSCNYIGIELNEEYIKLSLRRFKQGRLKW